MPFLPGIGVLLQKTPVPVVPVSIQGTFEAWPRQHRFPYPHPVIVRFGHPLDPKQWAGLPATKDAEVQIALEVRESVAALGKG
jgi:1-acyl-sn-glycerol-3-phosphate acyltransferase